MLVEDTPWKQVTIAYPGGSHGEREQQALAHLNDVLPKAEDDGLIAGWWFIRKGPWRVRYLPTADEEEAHRRLTERAIWTHDVYEPETHAFGGSDAMRIAHTLFHHDSRHLLTYLHHRPTDRRERSLTLCTALMRAAGLDIHEQADVWAQVYEHRATHLARIPDTGTPRTSRDRLAGQVRHFVSGTPREAADWHTAFATAGRSLSTLRATGRLTRGIRAVIAHHVIFHWNRIGIPIKTQAALARAGKVAVLGGPNETEPGTRAETHRAWEGGSSRRKWFTPDDDQPFKPFGI